MYLKLSQVAALFSFLIAFYLGAYVLFKSPQARSNQVFSIFSFALAALGFGEFMLRSSSLPGPALFWTKIIWLSFAFIPGSFFHLSLLISGFWEKAARSFYVLLFYLPALPIIILLFGTNTIIAGVTPSYLGFSSVKGPLFLLNPLYLTVLSLGAIAIVARTFLNATTLQVRKQTGYMLSGVLVQFCLSGLTQTVLPSVGITMPVGNLAMIIGLFFFTVAIIKYGLMTLTLPNSAEAIIASLGDALIMINLEGRIISVNRAASHLFELSSEKLLIFSINNLFSYKTTEIIRMEKNAGNLLTTFLSAGGENRPVNLSFSAVRNRFGEIIGQVIIVRDLKPASQLIQELETTKQSLEEKVAARTAKLAAEKNNLEKRAAERTAELRARADELQFFDEAVIGREARILELEKELNNLKIELRNKAK